MEMGAPAVEASPLDRAIECLDGVTALAIALGVRQSVVSNWRARGQVPPERVLAVEAVTGGRVTRHDLRPDIFGPAPAPAEQDAAA